MAIKDWEDHLIEEGDELGGVPSFNDALMAAIPSPVNCHHQGDIPAAVCWSFLLLSLLSNGSTSYTPCEMEFEAGFIKEDNISIGLAFHLEMVGILLAALHCLLAVVALMVNVESLQRDMSTVVEGTAK